MAALLIEMENTTTRTREARTPVRPAKTLTREEALARLVGLLENETPDYVPHVMLEGEDALNQLARLRMAHAAYTLASTTDMQRVSNGAWMRRGRA